MNQQVWHTHTCTPTRTRVANERLRCRSGWGKKSVGGRVVCSGRVGVSVAVFVFVALETFDTFAIFVVLVVAVVTVSFLLFGNQITRSTLFSFWNSLLNLVLCAYSCAFKLNLTFVFLESSSKIHRSCR